VHPDVPLEHGDGVLVEELGLARPCPMIDATTSEIIRVSPAMNSSNAVGAANGRYSLFRPVNQFT
jgi:hypothetical protein